MPLEVIVKGGTFKPPFTRGVRVDVQPKSSIPIVSSMFCLLNQLLLISLAPFKPYGHDNLEPLQSKLSFIMWLIERVNTDLNSKCIISLKGNILMRIIKKISTIPISKASTRFKTFS